MLSAMTKHFQEDENGVARLCIVHEPTLANLWGNLHPVGRLYERPFDLERAISEHRAFVAVMEQEGVQVKRVTDVLRAGAEHGPCFDLAERIRLEDVAMKSLKYKLRDGIRPEKLTDTERHYISDEYKRQCVQKMNVNQLVDCILTCPTVTLDRSHRDTQLVAVEQSMRPLGNLIFTRDQQITTACGVVLGRMASPQREGEVEVMQQVFKKVGIQVVGSIEAPGRLEGGDFFAASDTVFIGTGLRSNSIAVKQLMDKKLLGDKCRYVVEVRDVFERSQDRMHLDCVFNIIGPKLVMLMDSLMGKTSMTRRLVTEYTREGPDQDFAINQHDIELVEYLESRGYNIIPIPERFQLKYGVNCLNLGAGTLVMMHEGAARIVANSPHFNGKIRLVEYANVVSMYGSLHCTSQVIRRDPVRSDEFSRPKRVESPARITASSHKTVTLVFASWDVALTHRDGIEAKRLAHEPSIAAAYGDLNGRQLQNHVLRELADLHLLLSSVQHTVNVFSCEEIYLPEDLKRSCPSAYFTSHPQAGKLALYSGCKSKLQEDALITALGYRFEEVVRCPLDSVHGANDLVMDPSKKTAYVTLQQPKELAAVVAWAKSLGVEVVVSLDLLDSVDLSLSRILFVGSRVVVACTELFDETSKEALRATLARETMLIEISAEQVTNHCTSIVELQLESNEIALILSQSVIAAFTHDQMSQLRKGADRIIDCNLRATQAIGLGSTREVVAPL